MIINFDKQFYKLPAIKEAIKAYENLAMFKQKELKDKIEVKIDNIDPKFKDVLKDEFCNYVLAKSKHGDKSD